MGNKISDLDLIRAQLSAAAQRMILIASEAEDSATVAEYLKKEAVLIAACVLALRICSIRTETVVSLSEEEAKVVSDAAIDKLMAQASKTIN